MRALLLLCLLPLASAVTYVPLAEMGTVVATKGSMTAPGLEGSVPMLECEGPACGNPRAPTRFTCEYTGAKWVCTHNAQPGVKVTYSDVSCEGHETDDRLFVKNSCGVVYGLEYAPVQTHMHHKPNPDAEAFLLLVFVGMIVLILVLKCVDWLDRRTPQPVPPPPPPPPPVCTCGWFHTCNNCLRRRGYSRDVCNCGWFYTCTNCLERRALRRMACGCMGSCHCAVRVRPAPATWAQPCMNDDETIYRPSSRMRTTGVTRPREPSPVQETYASNVSTGVTRRREPSPARTDNASNVSTGVTRRREPSPVVHDNETSSAATGVTRRR